MNIRYRDIQDEHTEIAFLANFLVFLYADNVDNLLIRRSMLWGTGFDMEVAIVQNTQSTVRSIKREAERRISENPKYEEHNPGLYNRVLRIQQHVNSCREGYCLERLDTLLNNYEVDFPW